MIIQFALFFIYAISIILVAKYMMIFFIRKISVSLRLSTGVTGQIIGYATSAPELIGTVAAAVVGMIATSMYNILSSNIINLLLFFSAVFFYKRQKELLNKRFLEEYIFVFITILLPAVILGLGIQTKWWIIPILASFFIIYLFIDRKYNYVKEHVEEKKEENLSEIPEDKLPKTKQITFYIIMLLLSLVILYFLGNKLGNTFEILGEIFHIPEMLLGALMGIVTSLPELTSFFSSYSYHKQDDSKDNEATLEAVNNLTSSNVSNIFFVQTIALLVYVLIY